MNPSMASPEPLSSGLFCAPRNADVVRDDLEDSVTRLVRACLRSPRTWVPTAGFVSPGLVDSDPPIMSSLRRSALLTAELVSLGWLRLLADLLDHLIRAYRTQPSDEQEAYRRDREKRPFVTPSA